MKFMITWKASPGSDAALAEHTAQWADLLDVEVLPGVDDAVASEVAARIFGAK